MRAVRTILAAAGLGGMLLGCAPETGDDQDVFRPEADVRVEAEVGPEAEAETDARPCTGAADCDDAIACTQDACRAGGVCGHTPLDELCGAGERCVPTVGCTSEDCTINEDCADGVYCDGDEECIGGHCFEDPAGRDCNDGNVCTDDRCDTTDDRCAHDAVVMEGCDVDGGDGGVPFNPLVHYDGRFWLAPPQSLSCSIVYSIDTLTFTRTDTELTVSGPPCAMVQAPPPADENFSVTCTQGCGTYTLSGTFADSNNFAGHWTATFPGCGACSPQNVDVVGARR